LQLGGGGGGGSRSWYGKKTIKGKKVTGPKKKGGSPSDDFDLSL